VLDGDSDPEGNPLTAVLISNPTHGSLSLADNGTFSYSHDGSETTIDSFTYRANDGELDSNTVTISISIAPVNDPPLAVSDAIEVDEGGTATALTNGVLSVLDGDSDPEGNPLTAVLISNPTHGSLSLADNGTFIYSHNGSETTIDSFTYRANDGELDSNTVTISISIAPVNDPPLAVSDAVEVDEGGTATALTNGVLSVLDGDSDPEGNPLTAKLFLYPTHGNLSLSNNGTFSYSHDGSETTSDSFTYRANDGELDSNTVTISISIEPVNDPPLAVSDAIEVDEGGTATSLTNGVLSVLDGDSDPEGDSLTAELISDPTHGSLSLAANGTFLYSHDGSETTSDTFSYRANDGTDLSAITTVTVTVNPVRIAAVPSMGLLGLIMLAAALLSLSLLEQPRHMR
jgi:VCBS repeat-containing protein